MTRRRYLLQPPLQPAQAAADLQLYGTAGCHLCDEAADLLGQAGIAFGSQDIADDEALVERYGLRIPVLRNLKSGQELDWPFDPAAARKLASGVPTPE